MWKYMWMLGWAEEASMCGTEGGLSGACGFRFTWLARWRQHFLRCLHSYGQRSYMAWTLWIPGGPLKDSPTTIIEPEEPK
jgi:hypothetical protein